MAGSPMARMKIRKGDHWRLTARPLFKLQRLMLLATLGLGELEQDRREGYEKASRRLITLKQPHRWFPDWGLEILELPQDALESGPLCRRSTDCA